MNRTVVLLLVLLSLWFPSCDEGAPSAEHSAPLPVDRAPVVQIHPHELVWEKLQQYYASLEDEQVDVSIFFADQVTSFFGSPKTRAEIKLSLEQGFEQVESRRLRMDSSTFSFTELGAGGYVAEFSGRVSMVRTSDGSEVHDIFRNRVTLDSDLMITAYESVQHSMDQAEESLRTSGPGSPQAFAETILTIIQSEQLQTLDAHFPQSTQPLLIIRSGAYTFPASFSSTSELLKHVPWLEGAYAGLHTRVTDGELPAFSCDDLFSAEGTFTGNISTYTAISDLMRDLEQADLEVFDPSRYDAVRKTEEMVTHRLIDTETGLSFCFGIINGTWKLLILDFASYDCSA